MARLGGLDPDPRSALPETAGPIDGRLTLAQRALLGATVFFATAGVGLFSLTLPGVAPFAAGLGWAWVLHRVRAWEESVGG